MGFLRTVSETQEQMALMKRASHNRITDNYLFAIPNGGLRDGRTAAILQRQGVKAGVPDLFLAYPVDPWPGLFIELKRTSPKGAVSEAQKVRIQLLKNVGFAVHVAYGWLEAWKIIEDYLGGKYGRQEVYSESNQKTRTVT